MDDVVTRANATDGTSRRCTLIVFGYGRAADDAVVRQIASPTDAQQSAVGEGDDTPASRPDNAHLLVQVWSLDGPELSSHADHIVSTLATPPRSVMGSTIVQVAMGDTPEQTKSKRRGRHAETRQARRDQKRQNKEMSRRMNVRR
jgi:hypothetical protein